MSILTTQMLRNENLYRDEFERSVYHRSSSLAVTVMVPVILVVCAIIAWAGHPLLSVLPYAAVIGVFVVSELWLRRQVPSPVLKPKKLFINSYGLLCLVLAAAWGLGILGPRVWGEDGDILSTVSGMVIGIALSLVIAVPLLTKRSRRRHHKDEHRIHASLND